MYYIRKTAGDRKQHIATILNVDEADFVCFMQDETAVKKNTTTFIAANGDMYEVLKADMWQEAGYLTRHEYLSELADDFGLPFNTVLALAHTLGPAEDFNMLVSQLEDMAI